jgi:hypothetical protein
MDNTRRHHILLMVKCSEAKRLPENERKYSFPKILLAGAGSAAAGALAGGLINMGIRKILKKPPGTFMTAKRLAMMAIPAAAVGAVVARGQAKKEMDRLATIPKDKPTDGDIDSTKV